MDKRGSHVDVIISFVIFISFIVFAYAILQPTFTTQQGKTVLANSLETLVVNNLSGNNLTIISFSARQSVLNNCVRLVSFLNNANIYNSTIVLRNSTGSIFPIYNSSGDLYVDISSNKQVNYLFGVYYSPSFNLIPSGTLNGCSVLQSGSSQNGYTLGVISTSSSKYIFDFNVVKLINGYKNNYNSLKNWFNLSAADNFGFSFTYQNQTIIGVSNQAPTFKSVYSQAFPVLYILSNSSVQSGILTIKVW